MQRRLPIALAALALLAALGALSVLMLRREPPQDPAATAAAAPDAPEATPARRPVRPAEPAPTPAPRTLRTVCTYPVAIDGGIANPVFGLAIRGRALDEAQLERELSGLLRGLTSAERESELARVRAAWPPRKTEAGWETALPDASQLELTAASPDGTLWDSAPVPDCGAEIRLRPARFTNLRGTVRAADTRTPVPDYRLLLRAPSKEFPDLSLLSGPDGAFAVRLRDPNAYLLMADSVQSSPLRPLSDVIVIDADMAQEPLDYLVAMPSGIEVLVYTGSGGPLEGAQVMAFSAASLDESTTSTLAASLAFAVSDAQGRARLELVPAPGLDLQVSKKDFLTHRQALPEGERAIKVTLEPAGEINLVFRDTVSGNLLDGPTDVRVHDASREDESGKANPRFQTASRNARPPVKLKLPAGTGPYVVQALQGEYVGSATLDTGDLVTAQRDGKPIEIAMAPEAQILVEVRSAAGKLPDDYAVSVRAGAKQWRAQAKALRSEPPGASEVLKVPGAAFFPLAIRVEGDGNFLGEATFHQRQESYTVDAAYSRFATVRLTFGPFAAPPRPGRRVEAKLYVDSIKRDFAFRGSELRGYLPVGRSDAALSWIDPGTGEPKSHLFELRITESAEPFDLEIGEDDLEGDR